MKHNKRIFLAVLLFLGILVSCKKESQSKNSPVAEKTWWGKLTYTGKSQEYYCVHFNADSSLVWSQLSGDLQGLWKLDGKHLTISLTGTSSKIQADISNDSKLENITDDASSFDINSGQIISTSITSLENTVWKGAVSPKGGADYSAQLNFMPATKVVILFGVGSHGPYSYTRSSSGAVIRTTIDTFNNFFGILISDTEMKGSYTSVDYPLQTTKQ